MQIKNRILLAALFFTAFSSLVYELVWCRELSYIFGNTALAASSVLAVFMGGLALGSLYGGRIIESRSRPFWFLGKLQLALGIICILTIFAIKGVAKSQSYLFEVESELVSFWLKMLLFLLTSSVLLVPTFLIGVAFPCILQLYHSEQALVGQSVSKCYWIDTLGASLGMLLGAFWLVPKIGFFQTSLIASSLNIAIGIVVFLTFGRTDRNLIKSSQIEPQLAAESHESTLNLKVIYFLFFLSGFAALVLEILWIRHWGLIYGSSLHAFAIVVVIFLVGLSFGSMLYEKFLKGIRNQIVLFSGIELCIGAVAIIATALFPHIEKVFLKIYYNTDSYAAFTLSMSVICLGLLLIPTTLMGMTVPTLCAVNVSGRHIGKDFGRLYAVNSLGALAGSFCAGFTIIPALGIYHSSFLASGIYIFIALVFLYCFCDSRRALRKAIAIFAAIILSTIAAFALLYMPNHVYGGVFYSGTIYKNEEDAQSFFKRSDTDVKNLRFLKNGVYGQVTVVGRANGLLLRTNGRIDSGTTGDLITYQSFLGHVPALIHDNPSRVLNIGLGAGWTVRAAATHPAVKSIDCVEINPVIIEANRDVLYYYNSDIVNNPKVNIIINDGRNYASYTKRTYDAVISEPTELSSSGTSALFTREFYGAAKNILNDDGILCQWFPRYEVTESDYKIILKTIKTVFPYAYELDISKIIGDDYYVSFLIIASKKPLNLSEKIEQLKTLRDGEPKDYYDYIQKFIPIVQRTLHRDNKALEDYLSNVTTVNTDDLPILEFHAAKTRFRKFRGE